MALIPGVYFFHWNCNCETHEAHLTEVDLEFGKYTKEQLELFHNFVPKPGLGTKTPPIEADGIHQSDILTIVIDFKDSTQPVTTDVIGNECGAFDVTEFGFDAADFDMVTKAILEEVQDDFFGELAGTIANQNGEDLAINFIEGDIGTPPPGISEYYYVQVGTGLEGPFTFALGVARGSAVRNSGGEGPNNETEIGDVVASVFTDNIQNLSGLNPSDALSTGNLEFSRNAVVGTLSHEIGHVLSLSHINNANSQQPTPSAAPIMGTGAIDLPSQLRITDREFSLSGMNQQNGNANVFHVSQLAGAVGLDDIFDGTVENSQLTINNGTPTGALADIASEDANNLSIIAGPMIGNPVQFEVTADSPFLNPPTLLLTVRSNANTPNLQQRIELFNFNSGQYVLVDESNLELDFSNVNLNFAVDVGRYVNPANCQIQCRISYDAVGPVLFYPWVVKVDQVQFEITE